MAEAALVEGGAARSNGWWGRHIRLLEAGAAGAAIVATILALVGVVVAIAAYITGLSTGVESLKTDVRDLKTAVTNVSTKLDESSTGPTNVGARP